jgi:hypothetical protein
MTNLVPVLKPSSQRNSRLAFALLLLNVTLVLVGALTTAWQVSRAATYQPAPTNLARQLLDPPSLA